MTSSTCKMFLGIGTSRTKDRCFSLCADDPTWSVEDLDFRHYETSAEARAAAITWVESLGYELDLERIKKELITEGSVDAQWLPVKRTQEGA